eukprot:2820553-Rhodomonas_salina.3
MPVISIGLRVSRTCRETGRYGPATSYVSTGLRVGRSPVEGVDVDLRLQLRVAPNPSSYHTLHTAPCRSTAHRIPSATAVPYIACTMRYRGTAHRTLSVLDPSYYALSTAHRIPSYGRSVPDIAYASLVLLVGK